MNSKTGFLFAVLFFSGCVVSCGKKQVEEKVDAGKSPALTPPVAPKEVAEKPKKTTPAFWTEVSLHAAIRAKNPGYSGNGVFKIDEQGQARVIALDKCGVSDLSPLAGMELMAIYLQECPVPDITALKGMPLVECYLEGTAVDDLSPLAGMITLRKLYLSGTVVKDLSPLKNMGITELNLVNTPVSDLSPLASLPLQMLWLTDTKVKDISPLAKCPLQSLTLHRTPVVDLSPLANTRLQRLHIGETPVTDLTPLASLQLTRLVFDYGGIKKGLDGIKAMRSLQEIGSKFEGSTPEDTIKDLVPPAQFWQGK